MKRFNRATSLSQEKFRALANPGNGDLGCMNPFPCSVLPQKALNSGILWPGLLGVCTTQRRRRVASFDYCIIPIMERNSAPWAQRFFQSVLARAAEGTLACSF